MLDIKEEHAARTKKQHKQTKGIKKRVSSDVKAREIWSGTSIRDPGCSIQPYRLCTAQLHRVPFLHIRD